MHTNNITKHRSIFQFYCTFILAVAALFLFLPHQVDAHENNIVHSGFTNSAATLADINEITDRCFFDIATDPQCSFIDEGSVKEDRFLDAASSWDTVTWGTSTCGVSTASWINHSYNPITGDGWWDLGGIDALAYAVPIWNQALWDYSYGDQNDAYFRLGRVCHLLEDTTSPAHAHGDVHAAGDDFEDWGLANLGSYDFSSMGLVPEIPTGTVILPDATEVDADSIEGYIHSLALYSYNLSAFDGHLVDEEVTQPDSELARMFPTLHYYDGGILGDNYWEIDDIGRFEETGSDEWWACVGDNVDYQDSNDVRHVEGNFYIENAGGDSGTLTPAAF